MDWQTGLWRCEGRADAFERTLRRAEIVEVIREMGSAGIIEIAAAVDLDKGNVYKICAEMCAGGVLVKSGYGRGKVRYTLLDDEEDMEDIEMLQ